MQPDPRLVEIAQRIADQEPIDWDAFELAAPELAASARNLKLLQSLSLVCSPRDMSEETLESPAAGTPSTPRVPGPQTWGRLTRLRPMGHGSFGDVYRAFDPTLERDVALKLRKPMAEGELSAYRRHLDEARRLARVRHPHVVIIHGVETHDDRPGMWMDLVDGDDLDHVLAQAGPLTREELLRVGIEVAEALHATHTADLIHGDVKPANIMRRTDGSHVLMDFGAGRRQQHSSDEERQGEAGAQGTPVAMAPELLDGKQPSVATDLYALGVLLYRMGTGNYPFQADSFLELLEQVHHASYPSLTAARLGIGSDVSDIVGRLLARNPDDRPGNAAQVAIELRLLSSTDSVTPERLPKWAELPAPPTRLIGRRRELLGIVRGLADHRCVTLTGPGGVGKTRLAIEASRLLAPQFPGGVHWIDVSGLSPTDEIDQAVARSLGVSSGGDTIVGALKKCLGDRTVLLTIDNAEHVVPSCSRLLDELFDECSQVRAIVTSREKLSSSLAVGLPIDPFLVPKDSVVSGIDSRSGIDTHADADDNMDDDLDADRGMDRTADTDAGRNTDSRNIVRNDAVRLFVERARRIRPELAETTETLRNIATVCRRVEGIPLAIELAAARVRTFDVAEIARRLDSDFRLVMRGRAQTLSTHETLRASIDWSFDLLSPHELELMTALSVFRGSWSSDAAVEICERDFATESDVPALLDSLVDKSLVVREDKRKDATQRFRLLDTIRVRAEEGVKGEHPREALRRRHLAHFLAVAEEAEPKLQGAEQAATLKRLAVDHDNFEHALDAPFEDTETVDHTMRLTTCLARYWARNGLLGHGVRRIREVLQRPGADAPTKRHAALQTWLGNLLEAVNDFEAAILAHKENCRLSESFGDRRSVAVGLANASNGFYGLGALDAALDHAKRSLGIMQELEDATGIAFALGAVGRVLERMGDFAGSLDHQLQSLEVHRQREDAYGIALAAHNAAGILLLMDRLEDAETYAREALQLRRDNQDRLGIASTTAYLGRIALGKGHIAQAKECFREAIQIRHNIGFALGVVHVLEHFLEAAMAEDDWERAATLLGSAATQRDDANAPLTHLEVEKWNRWEASIRDYVDEEAYRLAYDRGARLTREQAVEFAMSTHSESQKP